MRVGGRYVYAGMFGPAVVSRSRPLGGIAHPASVVLLLVAAAGGCSHSPGGWSGTGVRVRQEQMTLPWHTSLSVHQDDPLTIHPYPAVRKANTDRYAGKRIFDLIVLENEYLTVRVCPEVQGAVVRAVYKPTGQDLFFYEGQAKDWLPFWESGVKASFPYHEHGMRTLQPASWCVRRGADGSVTVALWMEFSRHTDPWEVRSYGRYSTMLLSQLITLRPAEGSFTVTYRVVNPSPYRQGLQCWNDVFFPRNHTASGAIQAGEPPPEASTSELIFPAAYVSHHAGKDFRRFRPEMAHLARYNYLPHISIFSWAIPYGFAGLWYPAPRINRLRIFDPNVAPGTKVFLNGEGAYVPGTTFSHTYNFVEIWGGFDNIFEGAEHWIAPGQARSFTHRFTLIEGIGKVHYANDDVAVHVRPTGDKPRAEAVTLRNVTDLRAAWNGKSLGRPRRCGPDRPARFDLPGGAESGRLVLRAAGRVILDRPFPLPIPDDESQHTRIRAALHRGIPESAERQNPRGHLWAMHRHPAGSAGRGRTLLRAGQLQRARAELGAALAANADDGEAWHLLGAILLEQDQIDDARFALDRALAARTPYRPAALFRAIVALGDKDLSLAGRLLSDLIAADEHQWEAKLLKIWIQTSTDPARAYKDALRLEAEDPADPRAKWVLIQSARAVGKEARAMHLALQKLLQEPGAPRRLLQFRAATQGRYVHPLRPRGS